MIKQSKTDSRPRVVIVGAGFAGLFAAKTLSKLPLDILLIDKQNYHLFQPLLYQVATAGLPPSDIAWPVRSILSAYENISVLLGAVEGVDVKKQRVQLNDEQLDYDYLVIATGATHSYFGQEHWREVAPGLKSIDDATAIRRRILMAFEKAEMAKDDALRKKYMRFVVVGAGPTGVEMAGTIAELAHYTLASDFRNIDPHSTDILLIEAGGRVLSAFHPSLSSYAQKSLEKLGVKIALNTLVTDCDQNGVTLGTEQVSAATIIWAAGVVASPAASWLNTECDRSGRVIVEKDLSVPTLPNVFVIGDTASVKDHQGNPVPGIAPAAKQQGKFVAKAIAARINNKVRPEFTYRHFGNLATIGRKSAVIELSFFRLKGWLAWWIWGIAHIYFLIGVPSPLFVSIRWFWQYITYSRGARLITGKNKEKNPPHNTE